jgi:haloacetate dehalogenase
VRKAGKGPPLLLLHGYPETHACWHKIASRLAEYCTVFVCDLPGYAQSGIAKTNCENNPYSKREMASALLSAMKQLDATPFTVAGHDRGGRVAYRLALDHPKSIAGLAVLSILPTFAMWRRLEKNEYAMRTFHWFLLAQPSPFPETFIRAGGSNYLRATLSSWSGTKDISPFDARALSAYEAAYSDQATIAAACGDYRAGWAVDRLHDRADLDAGRKISCPTLVLWGSAEFPDDGEMERAWCSISVRPVFHNIPCGHFLAEEAPDETAETLLRFMRFGPTEGTNEAVFGSHAEVAEHHNKGEA